MVQKNREILSKKYSKVIKEIDSQKNKNYLISKFASLDVTLKNIPSFM